MQQETCGCPPSPLRRERERLCGEVGHLSRAKLTDDALNLTENRKGPKKGKPLLGFLQLSGHVLMIIG